MSDINEIRFSGTIERLKSVNTKTGVSMVTLLLKVGQDKFKCVAFKNLADAILKCSDGDQISVSGSGSINSWKTEDGMWKNDFQVSCWRAEINGQTIEYEKNTGNGSQTINSRDDGPPLPPEPNERDPGAVFQHRGGPF
jgi:single-stranded DNA-binding protein